MHVLLKVCLSAGLLLCVHGVDPTAICYLPTFTSKYFNTVTQDHGTVYVDFTQELYLEFSNVTGIKYVHDFRNLKSYAIRTVGNTTTCKTANLPLSQVMHQCLLPYSRQVLQATGNMGYASGYKLAIQTWEVETDFNTIYRITLAGSSNRYFPVFLQQYGYHGVNNAYMYTAHGMSIRDKKIFDLPNECNIDANPLPSHVLVR